MRRGLLAAIAASTIALAGLALACGNASGDDAKGDEEVKPNLITFSKIDKAWAFGKGAETKVAVLDWLFDLSPEAMKKYVDPVSLVPGEEIGELKPWHGEWMAEIIHQVAPEAKIIPMRARSSVKRDYDEYVVKGIRLDADQGAVAVTCSMGPVEQSEALAAAIDYAESKGTIFINVHPEMIIVDGKMQQCEAGECNEKILHPGVFSVPDHPTRPRENRDVYVWPYDMQAKFKDGWGYSNGPPIVAGVVALMKSVNRDLKPAEIRQLIRTTTFVKDGFDVLDAEAAVREAKMRAE